MTHSFKISIERKPGLSDPEGATAKKALESMGYEGVGGVSFGRTIAIEIDAHDAKEAEARVADMCERLLANPVIESYTIEHSG